MERFIRETLQSVRDQSYPKFEVICIDDGSTDKTRQIAEEFGLSDNRFSVIEGPAKGVSAARNLGLRRAIGKFILFLDADDLLHPNAIKTFNVSLTKSNSIGSLTGVRKIDVHGNELRGEDNRLLVPQHNQLAALLKKNFVVNGGALALRTEVARKCGGYDEDLTYGEDWEFWCRVALIGNFHLVDGPALLYYRQVANGGNFGTRESSFIRPARCIQKLASNPSMQREFGSRLRFLLRARQIDDFWSGVRNRYQYGQKSVSLLQGLCGVLLYPDSVFRPNLIRRFVWSLKQFN